MESRNNTTVGAQYIAPKTLHPTPMDNPKSEEILLAREPLPQDFYLEETTEVAQKLLNCILIHKTPQGIIAGRISETEAYTQDDPACHAFRGKTPRNEAMFGEAGFSYVYFTYGMYHCFNIVTAKEGVGEAVLIRAVEPLFGMELMRHGRGLINQTFLKNNAENQIENEKLRTKVRDGRAFAGGPGKICQAFHLTREQNGLDLTHKETLWIAESTQNLDDKDDKRDKEIITTPRIGISQATALLWRFYLKNELYISRK